MRHDSRTNRISDSSKPEGVCDAGASDLDADLQNIRVVMGQEADPAHTEGAQQKSTGRQRRLKNKAAQKKQKMNHRWRTEYFAVILQMSDRWVLRPLMSFLKRPDAPKRLAVSFLLVFFILRPGFIAFLLLMATLTAIVLYLSLGPERAQKWIVSRYDRLCERDPKAAERLRQRSARVSRKLSVIVEKLPERWTTGLYLPDFEPPEPEPEKFKTDPFERLAKQ